MRDLVTDQFISAAAADLAVLKHPVHERLAFRRTLCLLGAAVSSDSVKRCEAQVIPRLAR